jgi:hypothetical protein
MTVAKEHLNMLCLVGVQEVRWNINGTKPAGEYTLYFCIEKGMTIMN